MPDVTVPTTLPDPIKLKAALDSVRDELQGTSPADIIVTPGLDPTTATSIAWGALPKIQAQRSALVARFGAEATTLLDRLPSVTLAAEQANVELSAADMQADLGKLAAEIGELHQLLITDLDSLANRGLLDRNRVDQGRPIQGYRTLVTSTLVLVSVAREFWARISHKTPLDIEEIDAIETKAQTFLGILNLRDAGSNRLPAVELRARAINLLVRTYGEARRQIGFVRFWEGDVDEIAPSLWSGRRRSRAAEPEVPVAPVTPVAPSPEMPITPVTPVGPGPSIGGSPFTS